ncbi:hypothetical protein CKF54_02820 [Psittacicella hinzii]|uniref:High-affinity zinc uptake system protein ZnuA n=1 Tax=Psittacicella hinzii TaxID=2028575 RepID=A0A3A1Y890_9GAMM|nr:zinc ABC transporter substrate-binding protein [Psittacicella hinzii]RIY33450.1 hypothetical protein CKF54_02820 [Psittacicella hinzii]
MKKTALSVALATFALFNTAEADVLSSIQPIGFIVADLTKNVTNNSVLIPANKSPHSAQLTPKDLATVKNSDLLVYIDDNMEISLGKVVNNSRTKPKNVLELSQIPAIKALLIKGVHHDHDEEEHHHDHHDDDDHKHDSHEHDDADTHKHTHSDDKTHKHEHSSEHSKEQHANEELEINYHIWTSPIIAQHIAQGIADKLIEIYPDKKETILSNLADFNQQLTLTNKELQELLTPNKMSNFYVYHDAYTYFETAYNFQSKNRGAIYFNVNVDPSVKVINELNNKAKEDNVKVIFTEPQFNQGIANKLAQSIGAKLGVLDPLGVDLKVQPGAYQEFLKNLGKSFSILLNQ